MSKRYVKLFLLAIRFGNKCIKEIHISRDFYYQIAQHIFEDPQFHLQNVQWVHGKREIFIFGVRILGSAK
jgi:hypothetical protein